MSWVLDSFVFANVVFTFRSYDLCMMRKMANMEKKKLSNTQTDKCDWLYWLHTWYLSFFLHEQNFWRIKFTPKKRVNYDKIHRKLPIFCVITAKYTVNCQFFALNLLKFTPAKKNLHENILVAFVTNIRYVLAVEISRTQHRIRRGLEFLSYRKSVLKLSMPTLCRR